MALALPFSFVSCDVETDEEPGSTNVVKMAGRWEVTIDMCDSNGQILAKDPYKIGIIEVQTYNTAANETNKMWISDLQNFWDFTFKMDVNYQARTFSATDVLYNTNMEKIAAAIAAGEKPVDKNGDPLIAEKATIINGKILEGAAKNLHGKDNDSIVFDISFTDDEPGTIYRMAGQRYTGFKE